MMNAELNLSAKQPIDDGARLASAQPKPDKSHCKNGNNIQCLHRQSAVHIGREDCAEAERVVQQAEWLRRTPAVG